MVLCDADIEAQMKLRKVVFFALQSEGGCGQVKPGQKLLFQGSLKMHEEQMCTGDSIFAMGRQGSYTLFSPFTIKMSSCTLDIIHNISQPIRYHVGDYLSQINNLAHVSLAANIWQEVWQNPKSSKCNAICRSDQKSVHIQNSGSILEGTTHTHQLIHIWTFWIFWRQKIPKSLPSGYFCLLANCSGKRTVVSTLSLQSIRF